ncbi:hypothetical protein FKM82_007612 [Ascaphus truei]
MILIERSASFCYEGVNGGDSSLQTVVMFSTLSESVLELRWISLEKHEPLTVLVSRRENGIYPTVPPSLHCSPFSEIFSVNP